MYKICISNLVYGQPYIDIFLNYHLKSIFENIDGHDFSSSHYLIFTDKDNMPLIESHENIKQLKDKLNVKLIKIEEVLEYDSRYKIQTLQVQWSARFALEHNFLFVIATADAYYGKDFLKNAIKHINNGHDGIVHQPIRTTYESSAKYLTSNSLSVDELFEVGFSNLHPIWTSSNWDNPYFSTSPYHMIWSDERSICLRGFSLSTSVVVPKEWMLLSSGCTDISYVSQLQNPYYSSDWSELPMLELQPLLCFYPPFGNKRSDIQSVVDWAIKSIPLENFENLSKYTIFKKINEPINEELILKSKLISGMLITYMSALKIEKRILLADHSRSN
ncbi:MAG: hypothetical protein K9J38_09760 [Polynucleobacter sp.]|jgi:hypothetical protein|nr:hypothetical protein [Polynucleobacter sp.]